MSGDCEKCGEHCLECKCYVSNLGYRIIQIIESNGIAQEKLKTILYHDMFEGLSKHNSYWKSEHEVECDKLDHIRMTLKCMQDNLWDVWRVLSQNEE